MLKRTGTLAAARRGRRMRRALGEALAGACDEQRVFELICAIIVGEGGHPWAWVGKAEHDERRTVRPMALAGKGAEVITTMEVVWSANERGSGPTGTAIRTRVPCVMARMEADPRPTLWREIAVREGFTVALSLPFVIDGDLFGAVTVYARDAAAFSVDEVALLVDLVQDAARCVAKLRARDIASRTVAEIARVASEQQLALIADHIDDLLWVFDPTADRMMYASPAFEAIFGRPPPGYDRRMPDWLAAIHPDDLAGVQRDISACVQGKRRVESAFRVLHPDGSVRYVRASASPVLDGAGEVMRVVGVSRDVTAEAAPVSASRRRAR